MAKAMEYISDFVFVSMANVTFVRRDSYLAHFKLGLKQDNLATLRQAPLDLPTLFPDSVLRKARRTSVSLRTKVTLTVTQLVARTGVTTHTEGRIDRHRIRSMVNRPGKHLDVSARRKVVIIPTSIHHIRPGVSRPLNDNYCVNAPELTEPRYCKLISQGQSIPPIQKVG